MDIRKELFKLQDLKYKEFHSKLCSTKYEIIGVRIPILKNFSKKIYKEDNEVLTKIGDKYYEEIMLQGQIIALSTISVDKKVSLIEKYVKKIDNWAICDTFCAALKIKKNEEKIYFKFIKKYLNSKKEFEIRFLVIMLLDHFLSEVYLHEVLSIINTIYKEDYYVKMAIAWLLSFIYIKYPKYYLDNINKLNIDTWTYNKSIQKIIESNRVSKEDKDYLRTLKK